MTKFVGKPYAGKPHVRIDEGEGKVLSLSSLLYCNLLPLCVKIPAKNTLVFSSVDLHRFSSTEFHRERSTEIQRF